MRRTSVQPKNSLEFRCAGHPAWNGLVRYRTLGQMNRALRNVADMAPAAVLERLEVNARGEGRPQEIPVWRLRNGSQEYVL